MEEEQGNYSYGVNGKRDRLERITVRRYSPSKTRIFRCQRTTSTQTITNCE